MSKITAAAYGDDWLGAVRGRARPGTNVMLGARRWARKIVRALRRLLGYLLAHGVAPSDDDFSDGGVARGVNPRQVRSRLLLAATAGSAPADAAQQLGASAMLGARRSARQMDVRCGGCSAARSRSASRRRMTKLVMAAWRAE